MKKGQAGTRRLNRRLQALLNPPDHGKAEVSLRTWLAEERGVLRAGDRVIQVRAHRSSVVEQVVPDVCWSQDSSQQRGASLAGCQ